jgi:aspartate carbamoyltransferase catalytic subunit
MLSRGDHLLSIQQLESADIPHLFKIADSMQPYVLRQKRTRVLDGAILANLFFEPSTRTRVSFGTAFNLLGGHVRETVGMKASALAKGESLYDMAKVISCYADCVAMRHPESGSVAEFATGSDVPVLNGGDGANEHPTQALLDLYTIYKELGQNGKSLDQASIAMVGDLKHGRTVHSLSKLLNNCAPVSINLVAPNALQMPDSIIRALETHGHQVQTFSDLAEGVQSTDVVYQTRIQEERFETQEEANLYRGQFRIDKQLFDDACEQSTILMHPLPRDSRPEANELNDDLNLLDNLAIFRQTFNGVSMRMALFATVLDVVDSVHQYAENVPWYSNKK